MKRMRNRWISAATILALGSTGILGLAYAQHPALASHSRCAFTRPEPSDPGSSPMLKDATCAANACVSEEDDPMESEMNLLSETVDRITQ
jgi:hypothetical protein